MAANSIPQKTNKNRDLDTGIEFSHNSHRLGRPGTAFAAKDFFA
jgi:hypothetical protein